LFGIREALQHSGTVDVDCGSLHSTSQVGSDMLDHGGEVEPILESNGNQLTSPRCLFRGGMSACCSNQRQQGNRNGGAMGALRASGHGYRSAAARLMAEDICSVTTPVCSRTTCIARLPMSKVYLSSFFFLRRHRLRTCCDLPLPLYTRAPPERRFSFTR
jgi:hypothetical protein